MSLEATLVMTITAFTACDPQMRCDGIMANGHHVFQGAAACPPDWAFGVVFYIPSLRRWGMCADRGSAIGPGRLDLWMRSRGEALKFGKQKLQVVLPWGKWGKNDVQNRERRPLCPGHHPLPGDPGSVARNATYRR